MIRIADAAGTPSGAYDVTYYTVDVSGSVTREAACDASVSAAYVNGLKPRSMQVIYAGCTSQPGGVTLYGSAAAKRAFELSRFAG